MRCPRDNTELESFDLHGIPVDRCPKCAGLWLDYSELDELEDTVFSDDEFKGTLVFSDTATSLPCPVCGKPLKQFKYRLNDLVLEHCPNMHGFWLDAEEDARVQDLLKRRAKALGRKSEAEKEWAKALKRLRSPSFADKLKGLFK
jgi:Zn-finger nucleic acid-binding protein